MTFCQLRYYLGMKITDLIWTPKAKPQHLLDPAPWACSHLYQVSEQSIFRESLLPLQDWGWCHRFAALFCRRCRPKARIGMRRDSVHFSVEELIPAHMRRLLWSSMFWVWIGLALSELADVSTFLSLLWREGCVTYNVASSSSWCQ